MQMDSVSSAIVQLLLFGGVPCLVYYLYHRLRYRRSLRDVAVRLGICVGNPKWLGYAAAISAAAVIALVTSSSSFRALVGEGLAQQQFAGLGITPASIVAALLYGVVQTGLSEEVLFRGLIAGSLQRRLPLRWANLVQALIFLLPHAPILFVAPELWGVLVAVLAAALVLGWLRMRSGSILGPWLFHASVNVTTALVVMSAPQ